MIGRGGTGINQSSPHSVDQLIRELIQTGRTATEEEIAQIIERMQAAPFNTAIVRVQVRERSATYQGQTLGAQEDALTFHLIKRVVIERQWTPGTTAEQYVEDLRRAISHPLARLAVYERRREHCAATITPTAGVLPLERHGSQAESQLLVVYSADRGIILTGYQFSELERTSIPGTARWLK